MRGYVLTRTTSSVGIAISHESVFTLAPIALQFWQRYEVGPLIPRACIVRVVDDRLIQLFFREITTTSIHPYWKSPHYLDLERGSVEIREVGMEKSGVIVGE